ncbi:peptide-methionine (S)-S-oxide reductase/peptide methionine sulfoxide reductase msrA/msrB [Entomoplasma freundtii]|uniref:Peptide methionine sulfoxide reductase MsrA n=1 Tax=Entomoplasma freundtii TaxID=74700 RepID=A0A2K8NVD3_9MOLU|nr:peptide-methionine (S)-S-oxide reductase MsrA [Entomoplasma freundtii]ATZ16593.1 peptide methionine sulfoxide reductase [Entomoplasma freundtii]TDY58241.1 peptide-methionine (S)-S-oxide reductase/peptide methionine sulfoxide reductase msrA/msrB [Entomoplasma freundtii]
MKRVITLGAGCFWGPQAFFDRLPGVIKTTVGYANGCEDHVTYEQVCSATTNFVEAVQIVFDDEKITLNKLLNYFFNSIDPTTLNRQGPDWGRQYRTGVYYLPQDKRDFLPLIKEVANYEQRKYHEKIVTEIEPLVKFIPAEEYHQKYLDKNPHRQCHFGWRKK